MYVTIEDVLTLFLLLLHVYISNATTNTADYRAAATLAVRLERYNEAIGYTDSIVDGFQDDNSVVEVTKPFSKSLDIDINVWFTLSKMAVSQQYVDRHKQEKEKLKGQIDEKIQRAITKTESIKSQTTGKVGATTMALLAELDFLIDKYFVATQETLQDAITAKDAQYRALKTHVKNNKQAMITSNKGSFFSVINYFVVQGKYQDCLDLITEMKNELGTPSDEDGRKHLADLNREYDLIKVMPTAGDLIDVASLAFRCERFDKAISWMQWGVEKKTFFEEGSTIITTQSYNILMKQHVEVYETLEKEDVDGLAPGKKQQITSYKDDQVKKANKLHSEFWILWSNLPSMLINNPNQASKTQVWAGFWVTLGIMDHEKMKYAPDAENAELQRSAERNFENALDTAVEKIVHELWELNERILRPACEFYYFVEEYDKGLAAITKVENKVKEYKAEHPEFANEADSVIQTLNSVKQTFQEAKNNQS